MIQIKSSIQASFLLLWRMGAFVISCYTTSLSQVPQTPQFDPSDVYFQGFLEVRSAEQLEKEEDFLAALEKYRQAEKLFDSVRKFYPDWKSNMVQNRASITSRSLKSIEAKALEQTERKRGIMAELEGGEKVGTKQEEPILESSEIDIVDREAKDTASSRLFQEDPLLRKRLKEAEIELERLKSEKKLAPLPSDPNTKRELSEAQKELEKLRNAISKADFKSQEAMRNATMVDDLRKQNQTLAEKIQNSEKNIQDLKSQLATAPVRSEMQHLQNQIKNLEEEQNVMRFALKNSRTEHNEALSKIEILKTDLDLMNQKVRDLQQTEANLKRDISKEREVANEVVKGQRNQIEALHQSLKDKTKQLDNAYEVIGKLKGKLEESQHAYTELKKEHNQLLEERDQMSALLNLNESGRIEQLIEQNMGLAKQLRESKENLNRMNLENNSSKDTMVSAQQDLAIAKSQIIRLQNENKAQEKRLEQLSEKLKAEEKALAEGIAGVDPAETEMLREVIRRQLRSQERRKQAKNLLIDAAIKLGNEQDTELKEAVEFLKGEEITLSPEEQKLLANQEIDGEFISPFARDRSSVKQATFELNTDIESYDRAAEKAYLAGRLHPTRELYELMIEKNPGHIPTLCKLGVVQLKLSATTEALESFRKAVELDDNNSYAHRMLGYCYVVLDDLTLAQKHIQRSIILSPEDSKAHCLMGTIAFRKKDLPLSERHFKSAIASDPIPSEPYFNLALIYSKTKRLKDGLDHYQKAIIRGALPDSDLEKSLNPQP